MSGNELIYGLGATQIAIPPNTTVAINPTLRGIRGWMIKNLNAATLSIVQSANTATFTAANGYPIGTEVVTISGPAQFFLAAGGATAVAGLAFQFSAGYSSFP